MEMLVTTLQGCTTGEKAALKKAVIAEYMAKKTANASQDVVSCYKELLVNFGLEE
jgi:hypothetical protein